VCGAIDPLKLAFPGNPSRARKQAVSPALAIPSAFRNQARSEGLRGLEAGPSCFYILPGDQSQNLLAA
jgi:hypothetical protein